MEIATKSAGTAQKPNDIKQWQVIIEGSVVAMVTTGTFMAFVPRHNSR